MNNEVTILLVEDNPADVRLVTEALKDARVYNQIYSVTDGRQAIDFLTSQNGQNSEKVQPGLILLDLELPQVSGLEVLQFIKGDESLKTIPTVIMTSSQEESDIAKAYKSQANCYITKPVDFDKLTQVVKSIESFWLTVVHLPKTTAG